MLIPRVIHRIWLGDLPLPSDCEGFGETWALQHPSWEMKLWRDADLPDMRNTELFREATSQASRADIARYEILLRYGGVYVDADFECLKPLDDLIEHDEAFIGTENGIYLSNSLMGAVPGHPLLAAAVERLQDSFKANPGAPAHVVTGPRYLTRLVNDNPVLRSRLRVVEPTIFYPYLWNEKYRRDEEFPDSYAVHHWAASWVAETLPDAPRRFRLIVAVTAGRLATVALAMKWFARLFGPGDPVELVLTFARDPTDADIATVKRLAARMRINTAECAGILYESFAESSERPFDVALTGTFARLLPVEVAQAVRLLYRTHRLVAEFGRPAMACACGYPSLGGVGEDLRPALARAATRTPSTGETALTIVTWLTAAYICRTPRLMRLGRRVVDRSRAAKAEATRLLAGVRSGIPHTGEN